MEKTFVVSWPDGKFREPFIIAEDVQGALTHCLNNHNITVKDALPKFTQKQIDTAFGIKNCVEIIYAGFRAFCPVESGNTVIVEVTEAKDKISMLLVNLLECKEIFKTE